MALIASCRADIPRPAVQLDAGRPRTAGPIPEPWPPVREPDPYPPADAATGTPADRSAAIAADATVAPGAGTDAAVVSACGTQRPDLSEIDGVDSLAIAPDGTMYFTRVGEQEGWVGRLRPGGTSPELRWLRLPGGGIFLWGLALDSTRNQLYVATGDTHEILRVDLTRQPPQVSSLLTGVMVPNDLAVGGDGGIYYSERGDGKVYRIGPEGGRLEVTPSTVGDTNIVGGLAFGPDGALYVGTWDGPIMRIELSGGIERRRAPYGSYSGRGNGLAFDARGRLYVGTVAGGGAGARVVRIDGENGSTVDVQFGAQFSAMAFGRGSLDCRDLYIAVVDGPLRRLQTDTPGAPLP